MARNSTTGLKTRMMPALALVILTALSGWAGTGRVASIARTPSRSVEPEEATRASPHARILRKTIRTVMLWLLEPMMGPDGEMNWKALLWTNGRSRW